MNSRNRLSILTLSSALTWVFFAPPALAQSSHTGIRVHRERGNGVVSFLVPTPGNKTIGVPRGLGRSDPEDLLIQHGDLFGVTDVREQLTLTRTKVDQLGHTHTTFKQRHEGVGVFGGEIRVHQDGTRAFTAANGRFREIDPALDTLPTLGEQDAIDLAAGRMLSLDPFIDHVELTIVDPGWYGDIPTGPRLAYYIKLSDLEVPESYGFFIDAHSGEYLDQWDLLHTALDREVFENTVLVRDEGAAATGDAEIDGVYDWAGDAYNYLFRGHARDSFDNGGTTITLNTDLAIGCPNAVWASTSQSSFYCPGMVTDDIVAHEFGHAVTDSASELIYQNEPGQLNESFSDVLGELVDLFNGDAGFAGAPGGTAWDVQPSGVGTDTPNNLRTGCSPKPSYTDGVRWLISEDTTAVSPFDGAIRDMWDPTCMGHPDKASSVLQDCFPYDFGGVHSGSGIPNHGFAILTDGKTFNGQTVTGIGPIKAAAVWFRAYFTYMGTTSGFGDFGVALNQAATDLTGNPVADPRPGGATVLFTAADAAEVAKVVLAVEFGLPGGTCTLGACCQALLGACQDNVPDNLCFGVHNPGQLCSSLQPTCTRPSDTARMVVVLDRSGSMQAIRSTTGNTRCADAAAAAKKDISAFFKGHPARSVDVRTFNAVVTSVTSGFVSEVGAIAAINALPGICFGGTALADAICDAVGAFPGGLTIFDKVISVNTDGDEADSLGVCAGPASILGPPPPGTYTAGSWQESVYNTIDGNVVALIRNWTNFGGINNQLNPETGQTYGVGAAADSIFLQDFAGVSGGNFSTVLDDGPDPVPQTIDIFAVPGLPALGLGLLTVALGLHGVRRLRRGRVR